MAQTKIEWADKVWNPITGCTPISEGCQNCYARRMANRLKGRYGYPKDDPFQVMFHPKKLDEPLDWRKPQRIFVCSMGDMFHGKVQEEWINQIVGEIIYAYEHIFLILTKRPAAAELYFKSHPNSNPPNLWLGVSIENQWTADERIPILLNIPAAKRFVSVEPMLGEINLSESLGIRRYTTLDGLPETPYWKRLIGTPLLGILDWVICGGETGPKARPMHPDWVTSLRDQCQAAGVPFFFKQWGEWDVDYEHPTHIIMRDGTCEVINQGNSCSGVAIKKVGKKKAGRLLDGRTWEERPE